MVVQRAPKGFGARPGVHRYDVIFLKHPLTVDEALQSVTAKPGVDRVYAGEDEVYFSRLISKAAQSQLSRIVGKPAYQNMTIRNWNTTRKLLQLIEGMRVGPSASPVPNVRRSEILAQLLRGAARTVSRRVPLDAPPLLQRPASTTSKPN